LIVEFSRLSPATGLPATDPSDSSSEDDNTDIPGEASDTGSIDNSIIPEETSDTGSIDNTKEDYTHKTGATTPYAAQSMPKRPSRTTEPPKSASSGAYKWYTIDQQKYNKYLHWNNEALAALEHQFPHSLTPKRNEFETLPIS
jgi:hypothetical protein